MQGGKFIIFVLLASLAQTSFARDLEVTYGLTEDDLVNLNQIVTKEDPALVAMYEGFNPLFDAIQKSASSLIYGRGISVNLDIVPTIFKARLSLEKAWDQCLDTIPIAVERSCSTVEKARKATHANLVSAYNAIMSGMFLSASGKTSAALRAVALHYFTDSKGLAYNSTRICGNMKDPDQLAIVQKAEDRSTLTLTHLTNSLFNSMDVNAAAVSARKANVSLIYTIEGFRQQALEAIRINMGNGFSYIKAFYISSKLEQTVSFSDLASNQFARSMTTFKFHAMADAIYQTILTHLDRLSLGLKDAGRPDFTSDDAEEAIALARVIAGCNSLFDYIFTVHSNDASAASATRDELASFSEVVIGAIYNVIAVANAADTADNSDWQQKIEAIRDETLSYFAPASDAFFNAIRNGQTWDDESENKFSAFQNAGAEKVSESPRHIFNAITVLAKAVVANRADPSDFSEVVNDKAGSYSALDGFVQYVSAGGVIQLTAKSTN